MAGTACDILRWNTGYDAAVYIHKHRVVAFWSVLGFVFSACSPAHLTHFARMGPRPFYFRSQIIGIAGGEVQSSLQILTISSATPTREATTGTLQENASTAT